MKIFYGFGMQNGINMVHYICMLETYSKFEVSDMSVMRFLSLRELRSGTTKINEILSDDGKIVVTDNGKPAAFMIAVDETTFEETLNDLRQIRGLRTMRELQRQAKENGLSDMTLDDINAEIALARKEHQEKIANSGVN